MRKTTYSVLLLIAICLILGNQAFGMRIEGTNVFFESLTTMNSVSLEKRFEVYDIASITVEDGLTKVYTRDGRSCFVAEPVRKIFAGLRSSEFGDMFFLGKRACCINSMYVSEVNQVSRRAIILTEKSPIYENLSKNGLKAYASSSFATTNALSSPSPIIREALAIPKPQMTGLLKFKEQVSKAPPTPLKTVLTIAVTEGEEVAIVTKSPLLGAVTVVLIILVFFAISAYNGQLLA